jgi:OOP family OmpA-OmpF porin
MNLDSQAIQFDFDKASLKPHNKELLSKIAGILLTSRGHHIFVYGHTDDVGSEEYNQQLSERRAQTVRDYLVESFIDPAVVTSEGFGKSSPLLAGTSQEARAKNRRVEIAIVDTVLDYQQRTR